MNEILLKKGRIVKVRGIPLKLTEDVMTLGNKNNFRKVDEIENPEYYVLDN